MYFSAGSEQIYDVLIIGMKIPMNFAKFGWHKRTFCGEKVEKAVNQSKSDRL